MIIVKEKCNNDTEYFNIDNNHFINKGNKKQVAGEECRNPRYATLS